jgi:hypothetical protein
MSLTIEFAGISTLVWNKDKQEAEVRLVDMEAHDFHKHYAALGMTSAHGVSAPDPDISISVPGRPMELGVWNLKGTEVEIIGCDPGPLDVEDDPVNGVQPPQRFAESIRWLPDIGELCQSRRLSTKVRLATRIPIKSGRITATAANHELIRAQFLDDGRAVAPVRYYLPRFLVELPGKKISLRLDGKRTLEFSGDHEVIISNTCVCEPVVKKGSGHFYAHYLVVEPERQPRVRRLKNPPYGVKAMAWPMDPEFCFAAFVQI